MAAETDIVKRLREEYPEGVRAVATYDRDGYEVRYTEEAVEDEYTDEEFGEIYDDVVLQEIDSPFQESLFTDMGSIRGKFRLFEDGFVAHFWPTEDEQGLFVAFDDSVDPGVQTLYSMALEYYA